MIIRALLTAAAALAGWIGVLASVALLPGDRPAFLVLLPSEAFMADMPGDIAVIGATKRTLTVILPENESVASLYANGARLVLPSGLKGCAPLADPLEPTLPRA